MQTGHQQHMAQLGMLNGHQQQLLSELPEAHHQQILTEGHPQQLMQGEQQTLLPEAHAQQLLQAGHQQQLIQDGMQQQLMQSSHHQQMIQDSHQQVMQDAHQMQDAHHQQLLQDGLQQQLVQDGHDHAGMLDPHHAMQDGHSQQLLQDPQQHDGRHQMEGGHAEQLMADGRADPAHQQQIMQQHLDSAAAEQDSQALLQLQQKVERQAADLAAKAAEVEALNQRVANQAGEVEALKQQLSQQQQRASTGNAAEMQALAAQLQEVAARLQNAFAEHGEAQKQAGGLQAALSGLSSRLQRQQSELHGIQAHVQHLSQQILGHVSGVDHSGLGLEADGLNPLGNGMDASSWDLVPDSPNNVTPGAAPSYMAKQGMAWVPDGLGHLTKKKRPGSSLTPPPGVRPRNHMFPMQPQHAPALTMGHMGMHSSMAMGAALRWEDLAHRTMTPAPLPDIPEEVRGRLDPSGMYQGIAKVLHVTQVPKGCQKGGRGGTKLCKACSFDLDQKGEWLVAGGGSHPMLCQWCTKCFKENKDLRKKSDCKTHHPNAS